MLEIEYKNIAIANTAADVASKFLQLQSQYKMLHWQTFSFAEHKAFDSAFDEFLDLVDNFMEEYMGKYGRPQAEDFFVIKIENYTSEMAIKLTDGYIDFLVNQLPAALAKEDTNLLNIRDEMLGKLNQLKYLLTLK